MKYETPVLKTDRMVLHRGSEEDFQKVYEYDFCRLRDIAGEFVFVKQDPAGLAGFASYADEEDVMDWILYLASTGAPIGNITADRPDTQTNSMELAFNLHPDFWGQGYMKEAVIEVMRHLFRLGFSNVLCGYSEGNRKSKRLIEKLGFQPYRTAENAWQKNRQPITEYTCILSREEFSALYGEI